MWEAIHQFDADCVLAVNGLHRPWLDSIMVFLSEKEVWFPLYLFLGWILIQKLGWKHGLYAVVLLVGAIALSDQTASSVLKPFFQRLRPCHQPILGAKLFLPDGCGGQFGFASSHAANSFCLAAFFMFLFFKRYRAVVLLVIWAALVCLSRVYLGAHYPTDIAVGVAIGIVWASCSVVILRKWRLIPAN